MAPSREGITGSRQPSVSDRTGRCRPAIRPGVSPEANLCYAGTLPVADATSTLTLGPIVGLTAPVLRPLENALEKWREADGLAFDYEGD